MPMLTVTVDVFSGRPNPTWVLQADQAHAVLRTLSLNRGVVSDMNSGHPGLGLRRLTLHVQQEGLAASYGLPDRFAIATGATAAEGKALEIAEHLIAGMPLQPPSLDPLVLLDQDLQHMLRDALKSLPRVGPVGVNPSRLLKAAPAAPETCYETTAYNPDFWNGPDHIRHNNCYNYAANLRTDTFAQPGRASGNQAYPPYTCDEVRAAAVSDGARVDCPPDSQAPRWLMALAVAPGTASTSDYHWYRLASEGFWGHKPGQTAVKNTDNSGNVIYNPQTCDRGIYTQWCGYMYTQKSMSIR